MNVVCQEHLDQAIDMFIDTFESPPDLYHVNAVSFTQWTVPQHCDFCTQAPVYLII